MNCNAHGHVLVVVVASRSNLPAFLPPSEVAAVVVIHHSTHPTIAANPASNTAMGQSDLRGWSNCQDCAGIPNASREVRGN